jgi:DNA-binding transcriptional regulator YhcF (GntR family)
LVFINNKSDIPKYQQLVKTVNNLIGEMFLQKGDALLSVNKICNSNKLSRVTVFKAYTILIEIRIIESVRNKGYYIFNETKKKLIFYIGFFLCKNLKSKRIKSSFAL